MGKVKLPPTLLDVPVPSVKRIPHVWNRPTGDFTDHYAWLSDRDDPDTVAFLEQENALADGWFAQQGDLVDTIFTEIKSRVQETDVAAPVPKADWFYSTRTEEGQSYPIHCRGRTADTATDELVLDQNAEAEGHDFFDIGAFEISPDHRLAAWSCDTNGDEHYTLRIRDIAHQRDLDDEIHDTTWAGVAWSNDGTHLFYVEADEQERPYRVMRHRLGTAQSDDVEVYADHDERFFVGVGATRSTEWIVIQSGSKQSSECWLVPAGDPAAAPRCVRARADDLEYQVDHWGDRFVVVTNLDAVDFRVMEAPVDDPGDWSELIAHEPGRRITGVEPFADHLAVHEWNSAQPTIRILDRSHRSHTLQIDPSPHDIGFGPNEQWDTAVVRLVHQSLTTPARVIDVAVASGEITVVKQTPTPNVDLDRYVAARHWATADDGTQIPVDIVRHVDTPLDGSAPCCVYGYGSYEISMPPWFSVARLSLLDRGMVWALAHPRGGGELGRSWYLDGKLLHKRNTFTDTLAVCDHLTTSGIADADRIAIRGGSAGGLLVGACVTMEPSRFRSAIAEVPFVDVTTTMSDPTLPLTVTEWEEWGDPRSEPFASYIASYSPYDNTVAADYPALMITAGLNDPRVSYHEPAKWTAKLREVRTNDAPLILRTEMGAGHAGPSGRYDSWRDEARVLCFLLTTT
jgi:oligopeptidase B